MPNHQREIAGVFVGSAALLLIWQREYSLASNLLIGMLAFFIGERNGEKKAKSQV